MKGEDALGGKSVGNGDFFGDVQRYFGRSRMSPEQYSALALAYIGDAVFELVVRTAVIDLGNGRVKDFDRMASGISRASSQAKIARTLMDELTDEERMIYRHGRNAKSATTPKNATVAEYRMATGFEALVGYLYLCHKMDRALELIKKGMEKTELIPARTGKEDAK